MKGIKTNLIAVIVVLAVIAVVSPVSAHSITNGDVKCIDGDTWWNYTVTCNGAHDISHWVVFWCNETAVKEVRLNTTTDPLPNCADVGKKDLCWEYKTASEPDPTTGLQGIKIDNYEFEKGKSVNVSIKLDGCDYTESDSVKYAIKTGGNVHQGDQTVFTGWLYGPLAGGDCGDPSIPEFSTIAIPIAMILGLLFFFNHRKKRRG